MSVLQNGFSQNIKISADHDDFLTFHTREKSRLAYADVRLLAWRGISCVCEMANKVENIDLVGRGISCVCDGAGGEIQNCRFGSDTGRACDGAGLTYANMVRRKG